MAAWLLGLGGSDHDFSAALMKGSEIRVAIEQERLSRRKHSEAHWYENPIERSIEYCLTAEGISIGDIEGIVGSDVLPARVRFDLRDHQLRLFNHHLCHAASAYMMLPAEAKAGVLVYDGYGSIMRSDQQEALRCERETFSFYLFGHGPPELLGRTCGTAFVEQDDYPVGVTNSVGMLYELVTGLLGYDPMDSGKTMGLAAYGTPRFVDLFNEFITHGNDPSSCFRCATDDPKLSRALEKALFDGRGTFAVKADIAASVQAVINDVLLRCSNFFAGRDIEYLCVSGGCGLNTVANAYLVEHSTLGKPVAIPPHCGDAGLAFGALWLASQERTLGTLTFRDLGINAVCRPGRHYSTRECLEAAHHFYPRLALDPSVTSARDLAHELARGAIVGVLNGSSEFGPRALGGRSILADPHSVTVRERTNRLIKGREPFRPLAPIVLSERFADYFFDERQADRFMLKVARVRDRCRRDAPAVVHADGTARVQIVGSDDDEFLVALLKAFHERTGRALLLNTSFNRRSEPIVETPEDAIDAFLGLGLDGLYLNGLFYRQAASVLARP